MKRSIVALLMMAAFLPAAATEEMPGAARQKYEIYVDSEGVMRRSDTKQEVSYYGTNYTAPFAYSYRALGREGHDRKQSIDRDIYHIARMGMNAYRLHLWDAELADSAGNLLVNDHLDLLDYMISKLEERGIDIVLTAQTNFGNGYPERNIDTGSFTYDFEKCRIHDDPKAQEIQARYLTQLLKHKNPYTGRTLGGDKAIISWEINNEPCHSGTRKEVTAYIDRMTRAMRKAGYKRPILYNVTHNPGVTAAYYNAADIQGTTYQWYPTGLVAGHERKGNFLPALDNYTIPWDTLPAYDKLARVVYEFDPADVLYSHLYPAIARTFRSKGFQWITQFAYDPLELAQYNTEYPTHYMNLVYTPAKALSMTIAALAAAETPRGATNGSYPANTRFGNISVSHDPDVSIYNSPERFIYTNTIDAAPQDPSKLRQVIGHGSSPIVSYSGSGAYFLDATSQPGVWRLEVMPDVTIVDDPFANTSENDAKVIATARRQTMTVRIPALADNFNIFDFDGNKQSATAGQFTVSPGVLILAAAGVDPDFATLKNEKVAGNIGMTEYVMPAPSRIPVGLLSAKRNDPDIDLNMIPEAWEFNFDYRDPSWEVPPYYLLATHPTQEGITALRRRVGKKLSRVEGINPTTLHVAFMTTDVERGDSATQALPEGMEIAVVSRDGFTYSAPIVADSKGEAAVAISDLKPRTGVIMPAPYPSMIDRTVPAPTKPLAGFRDIEFVELIFPNVPGHNERILLREIWME